MNNDYERIWKKVVVALLRYYPNICLEQLRKMTKTSVRTATVPARIEKQTPPEYQSTTLPLDHPVRLKVLGNILI